MKIFYVIVAACIFLMSCGTINREIAKIVNVAEICHAGVLYLQFASGSSVAYMTDGKIKLCTDE